MGTATHGHCYGRLCAIKAGSLKLRVQILKLGQGMVLSCARGTGDELTDGARVTAIRLGVRLPACGA